MTVSYLTLAEFTARTIAQSGDIEALEDQAPGWIEQALFSQSSVIDARLRKTYNAPFSAPYPEIVKIWLTDLTTPLVYLKRGINPSDQQMEEIKSRADKVLEALREAADSKEGLYDLPLREDVASSGRARFTPLFGCDATPFDFKDRQLTALQQRRGF